MIGGNDSCDSLEDFEICSSECLSVLLDAYKNVSSKQDGRNTWWIEINHDYAFAYEGNGERPKTLKKYLGYLMNQGDPNWKGFNNNDC